MSNNKKSIESQAAEAYNAKMAGILHAEDMMNSIDESVNPAPNSLKKNKIKD